MVLSIDNRYIARRSPQRLGGLQPAEAGADNHDFGTA